MDSRKVVSKNDVIDLLVADRIMQTLSGECLGHVLSSEAQGWFKPDQLTDAIDVYLNSHFNVDSNDGKTQPRPIIRGIPAVQDP